MKKSFLLILSSLMLIGLSTYNINRNPSLLASIFQEYWVCNQNTHKCSKSSKKSSNAYTSSDSCQIACTPKPRLDKGKGYMHGWDYYCPNNAGILGCGCKQYIDEYGKYGSSGACQNALNKSKGISETIEEKKQAASNKNDSLSSSKLNYSRGSSSHKPGTVNPNFNYSRPSKCSGKLYENGYSMQQTWTGFKCVKNSSGCGEYPHYNACQQAIRNLTTGE